MKKLILSISLLLATATMRAQQESVSGPDGRLKLTFNLQDGLPTYAITYDGHQMLDASPLGFTCDTGDFATGLTYVRTDRQLYTDDYTLDRSKQSKVHYEANQMQIVLRNQQGNDFVINFRVSDNDVAFRYEMPNWRDKTNGKKFSVRVMSEATGFDLPLEATAFICPQSDAMIGWKGTKPSYEEEYVIDEPMTTPSAYGHGYTFPCLFRVGDDGWVLISETGVDSHYCASRLSDMTGDGLYTLQFPMPEENNGNGTVEPAMSLPNATPWRTITVGATLKPIVETTAPWDNVQPRYTSEHTYTYGKGTWSWIIWQDNSVCWDDQVQFIQLAKDMGFQYVLIDNWWDNNIGKDKMTELVRYAQSQGVDVFLWYSSSGWWNDIEQGPINIMSDPIRRKQYMRWMQEIGVKGIKVDFFGGDKQETMRLYEQILSDADDHGIMVIFHGCTLPRGWERMYPNYVGSEAVLASENIYFQQHFCDAEAVNTTLHPFIRNAVGCMEFGGCFLSRTLNRGNDPSKSGNKRRTTDVHELATCVLFQNPIQNFAVTPENLNEVGQGGAPTICLDFLRQVPTTWDETLFIDGYPGKYVVLARRSGDTWYVTGTNATGASLKLSLTLPMLQKGDQYTLYSDNAKTLEPECTAATFKGKPLTITIPSQGGFVIVR